MQLGWLWRGLRTGVVTTRYPDATESMPAAWRGVAALDAARCAPASDLPDCVRVCLPRALRLDERSVIRLDEAACIGCGLCVAACPTGALTMSGRFELSSRDREALAWPRGDAADG